MSQRGRDMHNKRAFQVILGAVGALALLWLLFACVAPPGADPVAAGPPELRDLQQSETCKTYTSVNVPKIIPDNEVTYTLSALPVWGAGALTKLTVSLTISHTYPADLEVALCSPRTAGCDLFLVDDLTTEGGEYTIAFSSDPTHTDFNDIYDGPPYTGTYPGGAVWAGVYGLERWINMPASGLWQLAVRDVAAIDTGSLTAWNMEVCTVPLRPTVTPTATATPLPTPPNGCTKNVFFAKSLGEGIDACDCSVEGFEELPLSGSGNSVSPYLLEGRICNVNCPGSIASVTAYAYADAWTNYFCSGIRPTRGRHCSGKCNTSPDSH